MSEDNFFWLIKWFHAHCDGDWEHGYGIHIDTLDNPGWSVTINLSETELENRKFDKVKVEQSDDDWFICFIQSKKFEGRCGPLNLPEIFRIFREWAES